MAQNQLYLTRVDITPDTPFPTPRSSSAIFTDGPRLEANIVIFETPQHGQTALIGLDTIFSSDELENSIQSHLDVPIKLICVATHSHNTPILFPHFAKCIGAQADHLEPTARRIAKAINLAVKGETTKVTHIEQSSCGVNGSVYRRKRAIYINRKTGLGIKYCMLPNRKVDIPRRLDLFVARDEAGTAQFVLWTWPCHATSYPDLQAISGDFPALCRDHIRTQLGLDIPIIYFPGFSGDIRPDISTWRKTTSINTWVNPFNETFAFAQKPYSKLCDELKSALNHCLDTKSQKTIPHGPSNVFGHMIPIHEINDDNTQTSLNYTLLEFMGLELWLFGAEICNGFIDIIKPLLRKPAILSGCTGHVLGYIPTNIQIAEGGYEPVESQRNFPIDGLFKADIETPISNNIESLLNYHNRI